MEGTTNLIFCAGMFKIIEGYIDIIDKVVDIHQSNNLILKEYEKIKRWTQPRLDWL